MTDEQKYYLGILADMQVSVSERICYAVDDMIHERCSPKEATQKVLESLAYIVEEHTEIIAKRKI